MKDFIAPIVVVVLYFASVGSIVFVCDHAMQAELNQLHGGK